MNYPYYSPHFCAQMPSQTRPVEMGQNYIPQANVPQTQSVGQTQGISPMSRPVTSKEEAMGIAADFSGAPMIFPDMAHNVIFVKRWDYQTGSAVFMEYAPKDTPPPPPEGAAESYVTQGDFKELMERLDEIESDIDRLKRKGAKKNDDE